MKILNLAVIGKDVSASTSPEIHSFIAKHMGNSVNYLLISIPETEFEERAESFFKSLDGFNVTIPYKLTVIPRLEKVVGDAEVFGAVNTVRTGDRSGYNTDGEGFSLMLKTNGIEVSGKEVLVLGAGGAGRSVAKKLKDAGAQVYIFDKNKDTALKVANEFNLFAVDEVRAESRYLIVNATGIGMHKTVGLSPVSSDILKFCDCAVDLIYTPEKSEFLRLAEAKGKKILNGAAMLFYQAYYAECIYFGQKADEEQAKELFRLYSEEL